MYCLQQSHTLIELIRYIFLALHWPPFCLQSPHKRFNTVLEFFLRNSEPYRHNRIRQRCESPVPPHSKDALLDANLVIVEAI